MRFSYSQVHLYEDNPWKHFCNYVMHLYPPQSDAAERGTDVHGTFETNQTSDEFTEKIKQAVEEVKRNDRKRESYMNYEEMVAWEAEHRALGIARGIAQELAKDMAANMAADMAESEKQTICKNMLSENLDISLVAKVTGYSIDEILEIQRNM